MKLSVLMLLVTGWSGVVVGAPDDPDRAWPFSTSLRRAMVVHVLEGLPNPHLESVLHTRERVRGDAMELEGFYFYRQPRRLPGGQELAALLGDDDALRRVAPNKKTGPFHPDFALAWSDGRFARAALISLVAQEVKLVGPEGSLRYDLSGEVYQRLLEILAPYRGLRPSS